MIRINIDLTKIKESKKYRTAKNGRNYIDLIVQERKSPDSDGNTHSVSISKSKEERDANAETVYVGSGKEFKPQQPAQQQQSATMQSNNAEIDF